MWTKNELEQLRQVDISKVNHNELKELTEMRIPHDLSSEQKLELLSQYLKNPYCYKVNGIPIQISFTNHNKSLEDCLINYFIKKIKSEHDKL